MEKVSSQTYPKKKEEKFNPRGIEFDICHLSVLNPPLHTRIFFKLALSQHTYGCRVAIIGQDPTSAPYLQDGIQILPLPPFGRLSFKRWLVLPFWLFKRIRKYPADVYWLHSPELMGMSLLLKIMGKRVVYDVHEDYFKTLYYAKHYPLLVRRPLAYLLRGLEKLWVRSLDAVVYAESCYNNVLNSTPSKTYVLRNTFSPRASAAIQSFPIPAQNYLLYTGTLAKEWGIFRTLSLWKKLNEIEELPLVVAGFTHSQSVLKELQSQVEVSGLTHLFTLIGGNSYVPYPHIVQLIQHCRVGTALYEVSPVIQGKIPTKFFEFMAFDKALLFSKDPTWEAFDQTHGLGVAWHEGMSPAYVWEAIRNWKVTHTPSSYAWEADEQVLFKLLDTLK